jgi:hypothetical protein
LILGREEENGFDRKDRREIPACTIGEAARRALDTQPSARDRVARAALPGFDLLEARDDFLADIALRHCGSLLR